MLTFEKKDDLFLITEHILSFRDTQTKRVYYSADLKQKRVNNEPWVETNTADRDWFNKYYRHHFETGKANS